MAKSGPRSVRVFRSGNGPLSDQPSLLPTTSDDLLESSHEVRSLWPLIESSVGCVLRGVAQDQGGILHDPARMFAVWMYALMQGQASSRNLEELCRYDVRYGFLSGGTRPDHATLARFRRRFEEVLPDLFSRVAQEGKASGLLGSRPLAVDGTKVPGAHSQWRRALARAGDFDSDARDMTDGHGMFLTGYNAQVAVDTGSTFVAGCSLSNEANDFGQMEPVLSAVKSQSAVELTQVVADSGFDSSPNHEAVQAHGAEGFIRPRKDHSVVFARDERGVLRCPAGHRPSLTHTTKSGLAYDVYRVSQCRNCPLKEGCGLKGKASQKEMAVRRGTRPELRTENSKRCQSPEGQALLRLRGPTVELAFARMKALFGFRRFRLENLAGARLEFSLLVLSYNLRLLMELFWALFEAVWTQNDSLKRPPEDQQTSNTLPLAA